MSRHLFWCFISFIASCLVTFLFGIEGALYVIFGMAIFLFILFIVQKGVRLAPFFCLLFFIFGTIRVEISKNHIKKFEESFYGKPLVIYCKLLTPIEDRVTYKRYKVETIEIISDKTAKKVKETLYIYVDTDPDFAVLPGDFFTASGILKEINPPMNKRSFDYYSYLQQRNIRGIFEPDPFSIQRAQGRKDLSDYLFKARLKVLDIYGKYLKSPGLLQGIVLGDTTNIDSETKLAFSKTGVTHIVALSGMNIAFLFTFVLFILKRSRMNYLIKITIAIAVIWIFVMMTLFEPSIIRAAIMGTLYLLAGAINREPDTISNLGIAAGIIAVFNPYAVFDVGYQLSCLAALGILLFSGLITKKLHFLHPTITELIAVTMAAQILTIPIISFTFGTVSVISLFANMIIVPFVSLIFLSGFVLIIVALILPFLAFIPAGFINFFLVIVTESAKALANVPYATVGYSISPSEFLLYFLFVTTLSILCNKKVYIAFKTAIVILFAIFIFMHVKSVIDNQNLMQVDYINVGQGDATLIKIPGSMPVLTDTGREYYGDELANFLAKQNIYELEAVILTHGDYDHSGGLKVLLNKIKINKLLFPLCSYLDNSTRELLDSARAKGIEIIYVKTGDEFLLNNAKIDILWPNPAVPNIKSYDNSNSIVFMLSYLNKKFLFTGDIEKDTEDAIIKENTDINAEVLKVAHHGSDTSSSQAFLNRVMPEISIIETGKNSYGHPSSNILNRLIPYSGQAFRTDINGTITVTVDKNGEINIDLFRNAR